MNRNVKPLPLLMTLALLLAACGPVVAPTEVPQEPTPTEVPPTEIPPATEDDFFYASGKKIPVTIALDQIGVLAHDGLPSEEVQAFARDFGLELVEEYPGGILIFAIGQQGDRASVLDLARELRRKGDKMIAQAGLVVRPLNAETPLIATDELVVQFAPGVGPDEIDELNASLGVEVLMEAPFVENYYLLAVTETSPGDALTLANLYEESKLTEYAHPNFVRVVIERETNPNDPLYGNQWHHRNTGQGGGTPDADVDTSWAWDFTMGSANVVIAVIDTGFDIGHPDLTPNLWANPGEIAGNGIDDDGNTYVDDTLGWDFTGCAPGAVGCGDNNPTGGNHGTSVAGTAAARGNNNLGVSGSCPNCQLMLIRSGHTFNEDSLSFNYARAMGAPIITNSWGYPVGTPLPTNVVNAINTAANAGSVVLFAMNNPNVNDCTGATPDISSLANVIAVSRSTNHDRFDFSGFGNCMDLLAPSAGCTTVGAGRGTLWGTTTDVQGANGYNNGGTACACPSAEPGPPPANARDYTLCFNGTSFATPLTAGVAGLLLSADATLTRQEVQRLLQDTADKVEDSTGSYAPNTGFSVPAGGNATHGWGRVNAFEAVRIVADPEVDGLGGTDIFLRDNRLDWGNTEQPSNTLFESPRGFIGHYRSMDIKVDAPPYQAVPTAATFDAFVDETPSAVAGDINRVYVRLRNRGPDPAAEVTIKLHWTQFGTALPPLPGDFWAAWPGDSADPASRWTAMECSTGGTVCTVNDLAYSGASVAGTAADVAQIVQFDFPAPPFDPALANHYCLLGMIDSTDDPISDDSRAIFVVDTITPNDNNVTHRNYHNLPTGEADRFEERFFVRNPYDEEVIVVRLTLDRAGLILQEKGWRIELDEFRFGEKFELEPGKEILVTVLFELPALELEGEISILQERLDREVPEVMGGVTYRFGPKLP